MSKITKETCESICSDYVTGILVKDITKKYSISKPSVFKILKHNNIELKSSRFNPELEKNVCKAYLDEIDTNTEELFKRFSISGNTFFRILKKYKIKLRNSINLDLEEQICKDFQDYSQTRDSILKKYNISKCKLFRILDNHGIPKRPKHRTYFFNENYFDKIDTPDKAQILGFLYADGCISGNHLMVALKSDDKQYLLDILTKFNAPHELLKFKPSWEHMGPNKTLIISKDQYFFQLNSRTLISACKKVGLIPRKSWANCSMPNENVLPKELRRYFIKGVLEGDGTINISKPWLGDGHKRYIGKRQVGWCGSFNLMIDIRNFIKQELDIETKLCSKKDSIIWSITYSRVNDVEKLLKWLYHDSQFHMERKFQKAQEVLSLIK